MLYHLTKQLSLVCMIMTVLFVTSNQTTLAQTAAGSGSYTIQVAAFKDGIPSNLFSERGLTGVRSDRKNNFTAYYYGSYASEEEAQAALGDITGKGFPYARVVSPAELNPNCARECSQPEPVKKIAPPPPPPKIIEVAPVRVQIRNIFFDFDRSDLRSKSISDLTELITLLNQNPSYKVEVHGHTDSKGSKEYNERLAKRRTSSVISYLTSNGIQRSRLRDVAFGEESPIAKNDIGGMDAPEGRQLNRRVELQVYAQEVKMDIVEPIIVPSHLSVD